MSARPAPPSPDADRADARLAWARAAAGDPALTLARASADAGFRSYWRADTRGGTRIVMDSPPALEDVRPWLRIRDRLEAGGVRVPRVLARDVDAGFLLLEDLGAETCLQVLQRQPDADARDAMFDAALTQLLSIQAMPCADDLPAYDAALLLRELSLFDTWYLGTHLGVRLDPPARAALDAAGKVLVEAALAQAQVFVHRDFMLRNLMPVESGVAVLDFQDAVRGPIAYDVLSLCKDAFASWPQARIDGWVADYHVRAAVAGLPVPELAQFRRDVDLIGVQRHLKVLGIFARLHHRDGKPRYVADAPRFLGYLDAVLPRYPELAGLHALLRRHAPAT
ncbi:phosphotransferase [Luteimonas sp. BDR2-5]|uniref:aminoglycoside phosphotransferase family protein n=1 Tax=Proluteimonas luteida TaxID=2878685 RepID=UPI001E5FB0C2|nr:phosphotransferase [Luteimonas sp. BDR2-5]MCD9029980.1 phosphotransferase [Luteimonas sp. BDR2-5]